MLLYTTNASLLCKFFPSTLTGFALIWYTSLPVGSINTFSQLEANGTLCSLQKVRKIKLSPTKYNTIRRRVSLRVLEKISWRYNGRDGLGRISCPIIPNQWDKDPQTKVPIGWESSKDVCRRDEVMSNLGHRLWYMSDTRFQEVETRQEGSRTFSSSFEIPLGTRILI